MTIHTHNIISKRLKKFRDFRNANFWLINNYLLLLGIIGNWRGEKYLIVGGIVLILLLIPTLLRELNKHIAKVTENMAMRRPSVEKYIRRKKLLFWTEWGIIVLYALSVYVPQSWSYVYLGALYISSFLVGRHSSGIDKKIAETYF